MAADEPHLLIYPFPTAGHIIPALDLTRLLLARGLTLTLALFPQHLPLVSSYSSPSLHTLILPAPDSGDEGPQTSRSMVARMRSLRDLHYPELRRWFQSHASPPLAILSDFFLGWTNELASDLGVVNVVFSPSGAFGMSVEYAIWTDLPPKDDHVSLSRVPGCPEYPWYQLSGIYREIERESLEWEFLRANMQSNLSSWGMLFNSYSELEQVYIDHLKKEIGSGRVWAVGPLLPPRDDDVGQADRGEPSSVPLRDVMSWLDARQKHSVVYICFGSRCEVTREQADALAWGLERSRVHFVWCVRRGESSPGAAADRRGRVIPEEFRDRTAGRGLIIEGWAPQVAVLRHEAVGAFVTHCGWNSTLEGISGGTVMLAWPMDADQFSNAKLLVEELRVGLRVGEWTRRIPEPDELARLLNKSVEEHMAERVRAGELQDAARDAVNGGSSYKNVDDFVRKINELGRTGKL